MVQGLLVAIALAIVLSLLGPPTRDLLLVEPMREYAVWRSRGTGNVTPPVQSSPPRVVLMVHIFAWRRTKALRRLWDSLVRAGSEFMDDDGDVDLRLVVHVDGGALPAVVDMVETELVLAWPAAWGPMRVDVVTAGGNMGLEKAIMRGVGQTAGHEAMALVLEDDLEVSPQLFRYARWCRQHWAGVGRRDDMLFGYALHTPRADELSIKGNESTVPWRPSDVLPVDRSQQAVFAMQVPCSWGFIVPMQRWNAFAAYYSHRTTSTNSRTASFPSKSHAWAKSWKKYLVEWMVHRGLFEIYLNLPDEASIVTNHYETGVHSFAAWHEPVIPDSLRPDRDLRFNVPLVQSASELDAVLFSSASAGNDLVVVDWTHSLSSRDALQRSATDGCSRN